MKWYSLKSLLVNIHTNIWQTLWQCILKPCSYKPMTNEGTSTYIPAEIQTIIIKTHCEPTWNSSSWFCNNGHIIGISFSWNKQMTKTGYLANKYMELYSWGFKYTLPASTQVRASQQIDSQWWEWECVHNRQQGRTGSNRHWRPLHSL